MNPNFPPFQIEKTKTPTAVKPSGALGFGQHFSDHMFVAKFSADKGWFEARILPYQNLSLAPACSVFHYAQSVFEGLKAFATKQGQILLFRPDYHARRLQESASSLCLPEIATTDFIQACQALVSLDKNFVPNNPDESLYIRPFLFASENFLGVRPANEILFVIITSPVGGYYSTSFRPTSIWIEEHRARSSPGGIGFAKASANYAASLKVGIEAKKKGFDQVLWLDACRHELIEEVGTMNIFFKFKNKLVTPPLSGTILAGCTRDAVITLANERGLPVEERPIAISEVFAAHQSGELEEAFGTGTAAVVSPIEKMATENRQLVLKKHETAISFYKAITDIQRGLVPDTHGWTVPLG